MVADRTMTPGEASASVVLEPSSETGTAPRSRRAVLAAALAGVAGAVAGALGRPEPAQAAAGDSLKVGQQNYGGSSATRLNTTSSGGAFWMTQYGFGSGVRGDSVNGHGGVFTTAHQDRYGLYAQQNGPAGTGAAILAAGGNNPGVYGGSISAAGVSGLSQTNLGIDGESDSGWGVYGFSGSSYAGYFSGTCFANSFETVAAAVRMDHPLDPATKVLAHSMVISDAPATMYAGTITTDARGEATVQLPSWFEALNTDVRYQLTTIGRAHAWIESEVKGNRFVIGTSDPDTKVSWQVTGVRADAYSKAHSLEVEQRKTGMEQGKYLNPIEHGQPASAAVDYSVREKGAARH